MGFWAVTLICRSLNKEVRVDGPVGPMSMQMKRGKKRNQGLVGFIMTSHLHCLKVFHSEKEKKTGHNMEKKLKKKAKE